MKKWTALWGKANKARLFRSITALWFLVRDKRTPLASKALAWLVLAYALSPVDLIPDFIPVLGLLDDLVLLPLGVMLVVRLAPAALWQEMLARAEQVHGRLPRMVWGLLLVLLLWLVALGFFIAWLFTRLGDALAVLEQPPLVLAALARVLA